MVFTATVLRGARRGVMSAKNGNKEYYRGRGCNKTGFLTRKGRFVVDPFRVVSFVVPDLSQCQLKPYVSYKGAKVESSVLTSDQLLAVAEVPTPAPAADETTSPKSFFGSMFGGKKD
eukprot:gene6076-1466_t